MKITTPIKIAIIAVPVFLGIVAILMIGSGENAEQNRVSFEIPVSDPDQEQAREASKEEAYLMEKKKKRAEKYAKESGNRISVNELFASPKTDSTKFVKESDLTFEQRIDSINNVKTKQDAPILRKSTPKRTYQKQTQKKVTTPKAVAPEVKKTAPAGVGFYSVGGGSSSEVATSDARKFVRATLEDEAVIKPRSRNVLTFILREDTEIDGQYFKKMSIIHAVAVFGSGLVQITSASITDTKGQNYPVTLVGYDKDRMPGIAYEGAWDEAVNNAAEDAVGSGTGRVSRASRGIAQAISSELESIPLYQGFEMFFKEDDKKRR